MELLIERGQMHDEKQSLPHLISQNNTQDEQQSNIENTLLNQDLFNTLNSLLNENDDVELELSDKKSDNNSDGKYSRISTNDESFNLNNNLEQSFNKNNEETSASNMTIKLSELMESQDDIIELNLINDHFYREIISEPQQNIKNDRKFLRALATNIIASINDSIYRKKRIGEEKDLQMSNLSWIGKSNKSNIYDDNSFNIFKFFDDYKEKNENNNLNSTATEFIPKKSSECDKLVKLSLNLDKIICNDNSCKLVDITNSPNNYKYEERHDHEQHQKNYKNDKENILSGNQNSSNNNELIKIYEI